MTEFFDQNKKLRPGALEKISKIASGYVSFLKDSNFLYLVFFVQIILSTYTVYLFYNLNQNFFSNKISLINSIVFSILPLNIYVSGQISSISFQVFLSILFFLAFRLIL